MRCAVARRAFAIKGSRGRQVLNSFAFTRNEMARDFAV